MFTLPSDFLSSALEYTSLFWQDIKLPVLLLFGLGVAFWGIERLIGIISHREEEDWEEEEYQKVKRMIEENDVEGLEDWIEKFGRGESKFG